MKRLDDPKKPCPRTTYENKHAVFLTLIGIVATLGATSFAVEGQAPKGKMYLKSVKLTAFEPVVYLLKSHGEAIARLRLQEGSHVEFANSDDPSGPVTHDAGKNSVTARNGITFKIAVGTNAVTVAVEEVTMDPRPWPAISESLSTKLIRLRSGGEIMAELKIAKGKSVGFEGKSGNYDLDGERINMKGDVTMRISSAGISPVVAKADEIEVVRESE